jgi:hypothetical protein
VQQLERGAAAERQRSLSCGGFEPHSRLGVATCKRGERENRASQGQEKETETKCVSGSPELFNRSGLVHRSPQKNPLSGPLLSTVVTGDFTQNPCPAVLSATGMGFCWRAAHRPIVPVQNLAEVPRFLPLVPSV